VPYSAKTPLSGHEIPNLKARGSASTTCGIAENKPQRRNKKIDKFLESESIVDEKDLEIIIVKETA
jgi:hypothetical protein